MSNATVSPPARLSLSVWGLAALFYLFGFFQRVTPASLATDLMRDFSLTATALGNLSAFYYYAYAAMQIPTGVLVDRLGPSRLFLTGSVLSGLGALLFAFATTPALAAAGRALIGASHGLAWVSMLKLVAHWFAPARFGTMSGLSLAVGTLGAVLAGPPLRQLADAFGWRPVIASSGLFSLSLAFVIWFVMRDDPSNRGYRSYVSASVSEPTRRAASIWRDVTDVFRYRNTWLLIVANSGIAGAFLAFSGLWGVPFFVQHHGLSVQQASLITSGMLVMFALGGPVFGALSDRWQKRKPPYLLGATLMTLGFVILAALPALPLAVLVPLMIAAGFGSGAMALSFGYAKESVPIHLQGTVTGVANAGVMLGTLTQMPVIGLILDYYWQGSSLGGVRQYQLPAFQTAFIFLAAWIGTSYAALWLSKEAVGATERSHQH